MQESFCMLRDKALVYRHTSDFHVKCSACSSPKHVVQDCPQLTLRLDRDFILSRFIRNPFQERKVYSRNFKTLFHAFGDLRRIQEDAEDLKDYMDEMEIKKQQEEEGLFLMEGKK